jgi:hypothetical protein
MSLPPPCNQPILLLDSETPGHRYWWIRQDSRTFYDECPGCRMRTVFFVNPTDPLQTGTTFCFVLPR